MNLDELRFAASRPGTLGVEMEWITVDAKTGEQTPAAPLVFAEVGEDHPRIKHELFTSTVEVNTEVHTDTRACIDELERHLGRITGILEPKGAALLSSGTHPFSDWRRQQVTADARYERLLARLQRMARRFNIFGIHVHVGMESGDACIETMNRLLPVMPVFLAISANSPFWNGEDTGLSSFRIKVFEGLSQGGMPFYFADWEDFVHCAARLMTTGSIDSVRDIWWEMRPHPDFGTLEVRIGDMPASREDTLAYVAYVRAEAMSARAQPELPRVHPSLIRENRWRACRNGVRARIIDPLTETQVPVLDWLERRLDRLADAGADPRDLELVRARIPHWRTEGDGACLQRALHRQYPDFAGMISAMRGLSGWKI